MSESNTSNSQAEGQPDDGADQQADQPEMLGAINDVPDPALQKDPKDWVSGGDPMTESQKSYLDTLARQAGEELPANLTKAEASEQIDRLQQKRG